MQQISEEVSGRFSWLRRFLQAAEVDRAVFYAVLARAWQFVAGSLTTFLIAFVFAPDLQGFYYTFASLLGLQAVAELGLHWIIVHAASHEWGQLELTGDGRVRGQEFALSRLASLVSLTQRWFAVVSTIFTVAIAVIGVLLFMQRGGVITWFAPWLCCCALVGLSLTISPNIAILEGCDQMAAANRFRLLQLVLGNLGVWLGMLAGAGLWVVVIGAAVRLVCEFFLVCVVYRRFWQSMKISPEGPKMDWRNEVWPLQWRSAVSSPTHFLAFQLFTPLMFHFHGPAVAGAMGMTWTVLNLLQQASIAWVQSRAPRFGMLIAQRDASQLHRLFFRVSLISMLVLLLGVTVFLSALALLNRLDYPIASNLSSRFLSPLTATVFASAVVVGHVPQCLSLYLRAHKEAPLFILSLVANLLTAAAVVFMAIHWGPLESGIALLAVSGLFRLPGSLLIWNHCRKTWYGSST